MKEVNKIIVGVVVMFTIFGLSMTTIYAEDNTNNSNIDINDYYPTIVFPELTDRDIATMDPDPQPTSSFADLPSQFSWTNLGGDWTTPAKDQANCGSCWAFGALGAFEAAINIASGYPDTDIDLSEQYILSCLGTAGSCGGGWMHSAINNIYSTAPGQSGNGINGNPIESCMFYQAVDYIPCDDKCEDWDYLTDPPAADNKLWPVEEWGWTTFQEDNTDHWDIMKTWIMDRGPLTIDIYYSSGLSNFGWNNHDPNAVYQNDDSGYTNHAQVLCGWKDDPQITTGGYWILKNSWGTGFGYNGFINIAYGSNSVATRDCTWVTSPGWPIEEGGGGPGPEIDNPDMHVFADFSWDVDYPKLGDEIEFNDESTGQVVLREWDFNGDGIIDSGLKRPKYTYYAEGDYEVTLTVWSTAGLNSTRTYNVAAKELWPPFAVVSPDYYGGDDMTVSFEGRLSYDVDGSVAGYHWDFDDGGTSTDGSVVHTFDEGDRIYNVEFTVTDNDGASTSKTVDICIDITTPPETECIFDLGYLDGDWFKTSKKVALSATDWTGVSYTMVKVDNGAWQEYSSPFTISSEGEHSISFYSVDIYGNEESVKSKDLRIDKSPPSLDMTINGGTAGDGWYTTLVDITLTGSDSLSGLDKIIFKTNNDPWRDYTQTFTMSDGCHLVWAFAIDKAGNNFGDEQPYYLCVDSGAPETNCIFSGDGSDDVYYKSVDVSLAGSDAGSGVKAIYYNLDNSGEKMFTETFTISEPGVHTMSYYAVDQIDNKEELKTVVFTVSAVNYIMDLVSPESKLYLFGIELFSLGKPLIIGPIDVIVDVDMISAVGPDVDYVEFFIDGESKMSDTEAPYVWTLDDKLFGDHEITVMVHSIDGSISESIIATLIIPF